MTRHEFDMQTSQQASEWRFDKQPKSKKEEDLGIPKTIVFGILTEDLGMNRVIAKFVLRVLTEDQKNSRVEIAEDILEFINKDPELLKRVITGNETWVYGYDYPETKAQSSQ